MRKTPKHTGVFATPSTKTMNKTSIFETHTSSAATPSREKNQKRSKHERERKEDKYESPSFQNRVAIVRGSRLQQQQMVFSSSTSSSTRCCSSSSCSSHLVRRHRSRFHCLESEKGCDRVGTRECCDIRKLSCSPSPHREFQFQSRAY